MQKKKVNAQDSNKNCIKEKRKTSKAFTLQSCNCTPKQQEGMGKIALWGLGTPTVFLLKNLHDIAEKWHLGPLHQQLLKCTSRHDDYLHMLEVWLRGLLSERSTFLPTLIAEDAERNDENWA